MLKADEKFLYGLLTLSQEQVLAQNKPPAGPQQARAGAGGKWMPPALAAGLVHARAPVGPGDGRCRRRGHLPGAGGGD